MTPYLLRVGIVLLLGLGSISADRATAGTTPSPEVSSSPSGSAVSPKVRQLLQDSPFVYISSTRKDGSLSKPAEIWFLWHENSIWVASAPTAWRVKRIGWKRPDATIHVGSLDGPTLRTRGEIVRDEAAYTRLCDTFAVKYKERWPRWERSFRDGLRSGERVLIRYRLLD